MKPVKLAGHQTCLPGDPTMKKLSKPTMRPTLTLTGEVVRTLSLTTTELRQVVGGGLKPVTNHSCGTGLTTWA
ncbi:MAG TPA: hypothetical protein VGC42_18615 [Kofleriaceae bacterium]